MRIMLTKRTTWTSQKCKRRAPHCAASSLSFALLLRACGQDDCLFDPRSLFPIIQSAAHLFQFRLASAPN